MIVEILSYAWAMFYKWLLLFFSPIQNFELLWIVIPIYLNWILTEIFQEKKGTSFGNAISNGFVPLWVGIDWGKTTYMMYQSNKIPFNSIFMTKILISVLMIFYGFFIISSGIKARDITQYIGRIRVVTYISLMFTPIFYNVVNLDFQLLISILVFFPLFYLIIEFIDDMIPNPKSFDEDAKRSNQKSPAQYHMMHNPQNPPNPMHKPHPGYYNLQNANDRNIHPAGAGLQSHHNNYYYPQHHNQNNFKK